MNRYFVVAFAIAAIASSPVLGGYSSPAYGAGHAVEAAPAGYLPAASSSSDGSSSSAAAASANSADGATVSNAGPGAYGASAYGNNQNIPYSTGNTRGNTVTSSITYPQNRGEILIHRPAAIIVRRPPTRVLVNHPPLVVKPAPVVLHKPPAVVLRRVFVKNHPRPVKVEPVYVNVVKPPAEKYFVNERQQQLAAAGLSAPIAPVASLAPGSSAAASAGDSNSASSAGINSNLASLQEQAAHNGYQLVPGSGGLAALSGLTGQGGYNPGY